MYYEQYICYINCKACCLISHEEGIPRKWGVVDIVVCLTPRKQDLV